MCYQLKLIARNRDIYVNNCDRLCSLRANRARRRTPQRPAPCTARVRKAQSARARVGYARSLSKTPRSGFHRNWPHPLFAHRVRENRPVAGGKGEKKETLK